MWTHAETIPRTRRKINTGYGTTWGNTKRNTKGWTVSTETCQLAGQQETELTTELAVGELCLPQCTIKWERLFED